MFDGVRFLGKVRSERRTFLVYEALQDYLLVSPRDPSGFAFDLAAVPRRYVEQVKSRFAKKTVRGADVQARLKGRSLWGLRSLQVLQARRQADPRNKQGRSMVFYVRA